MSGFYLHDPLAVAVALDPTLVLGDSYPITVSATGEQRGRTQTGARGTGPMVATQWRRTGLSALLEDVLGLPAVDTSTAFERAE